MNNMQYEQPFIRKKTDEEKAKEESKVMTIRLNAQELNMLEQVKVAIEQPKDSTAIKTMFYLAYYNVIHDQKTNYLLQTLFKNKRNNQRTGVIDFE